jgi:hypothetical protein
MQMIFRDQRRLILLLVLLLIAGLASAQSMWELQRAKDSALGVKRYKARFPVWVTPTRARSVNGIAIGLNASNRSDKDFTVNGINADLGGFAFFALPVIALFGAPTTNENHFGLYDDGSTNFFNGISVSVGGQVFAGINGLNISGLLTHASYINGLSVSGILSSSTRFKGIVISGVVNLAEQGRGIQIGLINSCKNLKGVQIGLWNISGNRGLPFFKWGRRR